MMLDISGLTFSQSLLAIEPLKSGRMTVSSARRKFLDLQSQQTCLLSQQNNHHHDLLRDKSRQSQHQECPPQYSLHVPSSVHCPIELSPIRNTHDDLVPFADALRSVRSRCLPIVSAVNADDFEWIDEGLQVNNSSGESSSRKVAAKESAKRDIDNFFFMYFRIRMENYVALVTALKQSSKDESIFNEESLDKWTHKYKFKIRRSAPLKKVLMAFSSRMGLEGDPDVMYSADGFYGDTFTGRTYNKNEVPNNRILPANTSIATGLRNGANIFVSRINNQERNNAIAQLQLDLLKGNEPSDDEADETTTPSPDQSNDPNGADKH